jgi:hypothetical protein
LIPGDSAQKTGSKGQGRCSKSAGGDSRVTMTRMEQAAGMELCLIAIISMSALIYYVAIRLPIASHIIIEEETSSKAS